MPSEFNEKRQARIERLHDRAEAKRNAGDQKIANARNMADQIPFGQPILVGHHSEQRDRNYRGKIESNFRSGFELQQEADALERRAQAAENNTAIFSDDPAATEKLEEKIARLEQRQELMKKANSLIRKGDDAGLLELGFSEARIALLKTPDYCGRVGFADFELKNNNANIRRLKERLADLQKKQSQETSERVLEDGTKLVDNVEENRLQIFFPEKPVEEVRKMLGSHGFHWTPSQGCWQRQRSNAAIWAAKQILGIK